MPTYRELLEQSLAPQAIPEQNRGLGEWLGDTGISALNAALGIPKALGGLGQLIPGVNRLADPFVSGINEAQEALYGKQSQIAQAARQEMLKAAQEGRYWDAAGSALTNPSNLADLVASGVASLGGMKLLGAGAGALAGGTGRFSQYAKNFIGRPSWQQAGALEGLYTAGAAADQFVDPEQFYNPERLAAIPLGAITGLIGGASARYLPGSDIEARLLGGAAPTEIPSSGVTGSLLNRMLSSPNTYLRAPMQGAREAGEEFLQSYQEALWPQGVMQGELNFDQAMAEGLLGAIPGGVIGGAYGIRNRPTQLPPPPPPAQGLPPPAQGLPGQFAQDSWFEVPQTSAMLGGQAIPSADYAAAVNAMYAPYTQGSRIATGQGITVPPGRPLDPTTTTSFFDLLANRQQPAPLTTAQQFEQEWRDYEIAQRAAAAQALSGQLPVADMGRTVGGMGLEGPTRPFIGAPTPAEGLRVIPGMPQAIEPPLQRSLPTGGGIHQALASYMSDPALQTPENKAFLQSLGVQFPETPMQRPSPDFVGPMPVTNNVPLPAVDPRLGMGEQQALPLAEVTEMLPRVRREELERIAAARGVPVGREFSAPIPPRAGAPEFEGPLPRGREATQGGLTFPPTRDFTRAEQPFDVVRDMTGEQAAAFLNQSHEQEVARQVRSGASLVNATQYADIVTGRALLAYKAEKAATEAERKAAREELAATQAEFDAYNQQFVQPRNEARAEYDKLSKGFAQAAAKPKGKTAEANKDAIDTVRGVAESYAQMEGPIPRVLPQQLQKLARLGHTIVSQTTRVESLDQDLAGIVKPPKVTAEYEATQRRIEEETKRLVQAKELADKSVPPLARQIREPLRSATTRIKRAAAALKEAEEANASAEDIATLRSELAAAQRMLQVRQAETPVEPKQDVATKANAARSEALSKLKGFLDENSYQELSEAEDVWKTAREIATKRVKAQDAAAKKAETNEASPRANEALVKFNNLANKLEQAVRANAPAQKVSALKTEVDTAAEQLRTAQQSTGPSEGAKIEKTITAYQNRVAAVTDKYAAKQGKENTKAAKDLAKIRAEVTGLSTGVKDADVGKPVVATSKLKATMAAAEEAQMKRQGLVRDTTKKNKGGWVTPEVLAAREKAEKEAKTPTEKAVATSKAKGTPPAQKPTTPTAESTEEPAKTPAEKSIDSRVRNLNKAIDKDGRQDLRDLVAAVIAEKKDVAAFITALEEAETFRKPAPNRPWTRTEIRATFNVASKKFGIDVEAILKTAAEARKPKVEELTPEGAITSFSKHLTTLAEPYVENMKAVSSAGVVTKAKFKDVIKAMQKALAIAADKNDPEQEKMAGLIYRTIKKLNKVNPGEVVDALEFFKAFPGLKGGLSESEIAEALARVLNIEEPIADEDAYVSAIATLIENPNNENVKGDEYLPIREQLRRIDNLTEAYEATRRYYNLNWQLLPSKEAKPKTTTREGATQADTDLQLLFDLTVDQTTTLDNLKEAYEVLEAAVKGGSKIVNAAQSAAKRSAGLKGESQTSPGVRFSMYYDMYVDDNLTPAMLANTAWRANASEFKAQGETEPPTPNSDYAREKDGLFTMRTGFGRVALGSRLDENKRETVHKQIRSKIESIRGKNPSYDDVTEDELIRQHAATEFILNWITVQSPSPFYNALARLSLDVLRNTGMLHNIKVVYKPYVSRTANASSAEYTFTKNGIAPGIDSHTITVYGNNVTLREQGKDVLVNKVAQRDFLHEVVHAFMVGYITNHPDSKEANAFRKMLAIEKVQNAMKEVVGENAWNQLDDTKKILEFISYTLTNKYIVETLKGITITPKGPNSHNGLYDALASLTDNFKGGVQNIYRAFVNVARGLFGLKRSESNAINNGLDAFFETFATAVASVRNKAIDLGKQGIEPYKALSPKVDTITLSSATAEDKFFEIQQQDREARELERLRKALDEKMSSPEELTPAQQRATKIGNSPAADIAFHDMETIAGSRSTYAAVDGLAKLVSIWIPTAYSKYAGLEGKYLKSWLHKTIESKPTMARFIGNVIDRYHLDERFYDALRNKIIRLNMTDNLAFGVFSNEELSFNKDEQREFFDYLNGKTTQVKNNILQRIAKEFKASVDEARLYGKLPPELVNASYEDVLVWNVGKKLPSIRGFSTDNLRKHFISRNNGHIIDNVDQVINAPSGKDAVGTKTNGWFKAYIDNNGKEVVEHAFVTADTSYEAQKGLIERVYGKGFVQSDKVYYIMNSTTVYRPFTQEERAKTDENASFIRSIAGTMQLLEHSVAFAKLTKEMIAENGNNTPLAQRYMYENTPENMAYLKKELGDNPDRLISESQAQRENKTQLLRTPGTWVILDQGSEWGDLYDKDTNTSYIIPATMYMALKDYNNTNNILNSKTLRFINRVWKKNMTVWSTTGHVTNTLSSFILAYYNDISPKNITKALGVIYRVKYTPEKASAEDFALFEDAEKRGALLGTANIVEELGGSVLRAQLEALQETSEKTGNTLIDHVNVATAMSGVLFNKVREWAKKGDIAASDVYANEDNVFRMAAYLSKVEEMVVAKGGKLTEAELERAGSWAADVMVNYNINARYIKFARETYWPFLAWPYRMVGQLSKLAVTKPWKLINTVAVVYALDALAYAMMGAAGDDDDEERAYMPPYMSESVWNTKIAPSYIRLPIGELGERGVFFGANRIVPLGDLMVVNDGMTVPQVAMPGGPIALMMQAAFNHDSFTQREIMPEGAPAADRADALISFLWRGMAPAVTTRGYDTFEKLYFGKQGPLGSEATAWIEIARLLGLNVREVDFAEAAYNKNIADRNAIQKIKGYARKMTSQELRYADPDQDEMQRLQDNMYQLLMERQE